MERLTKYSNETTHENGVCCTHFGSPECCEVGGNCALNCKWEEAAWERLARYEDTRLTPAEVHSAYGEWNAMMSVLNSIGSYDRLRELAEADKDGRVVILPCKVGDTVYYCGGALTPHVIKALVVDSRGLTGDIFGVIPADRGYTIRLKIDEIFRTQEEAERWLKG